MGSFFFWAPGRTCKEPGQTNLPVLLPSSGGWDKLAGVYSNHDRFKW